jgi:hypothetical protein
MTDETPVKRPPWRPREYDREEIANEMLDWSKEPNSRCLGQFTSKRDIPPQYISHLCKESKYFSEVLSMVRMNLGLNRLELALQAKFPLDEVKRHEYRYNPFYRQDEREEFLFREDARKRTDVHNEKESLRNTVKAVIEENGK